MSAAFMLVHHGWMVRFCAASSLELLLDELLSAKPNHFTLPARHNGIPAYILNQKEKWFFKNSFSLKWSKSSPALAWPLRRGTTLSAARQRSSTLSAGKTVMINYDSNDSDDEDWEDCDHFYHYEDQEGRTWQPFVGGKNGHGNFRQSWPEHRNLGMSTSIQAQQLPLYMRSPPPTRREQQDIDPLTRK